MVADGHRWNLDTGLKTGIAAGTRILPPSEESPTTRIEITQQGGEILTIDTHTAERAFQVAVNLDYNLAAVSFGNAVHLYRLQTAEAYAILPQEQSGVAALFFSGRAANPLLVVGTRQGYMNGMQINIYDGQTGILKSDYSGLSPTDLKTTPDRSLFAYGLEDKGLVIGSGSTLSLVQTNDKHLSQISLSVLGRVVSAVTDDNEHVELFILGENNVPQPPITVDLPAYMTGSITGHFSWMVFAARDGFMMLNTDDLESAPRLVTAKIGSYGNFRINPDGTRIAYFAKESGNYRIHDLESDTVLTELDPSGMVFINPDWSNLMYWEHGKLIVRDLNTFTDTVLEVLPTYVGAVVDINFATDKAAFSGETFSVIRVSNGRELALPPLDTVPYGAEFIRETGNLVTFSEEIEGEYTHWNEYIFAEDVMAGLTYIDYGSKGEFKMSPHGSYIISYNNYCDSPYSLPSVYLRPFVDVNAPLPDGMVADSHVSFGCGANAVAFVADDSLFYGVEGDRLIRFESKTRESSQDEGLYWYVMGLMYYDDYTSSDGLLYRTDSLSLSPDEQYVALYVDYYGGDNRDLVKAHAIEVFHLENLPETQRREDTTPALIIPDATTGVFSPDSQMIVTDVGLYGLENGLLSAAIDGTISAFSADSTILATYQDGAVTLWDVRNAESARYPLAQYQISGVTELGFSPESRRLYVVRAGEVQVWGIKTP